MRIRGSAVKGSELLRASVIRSAKPGVGGPKPAGALWAIAWWYRPSASGATSRAVTDPAPGRLATDRDLIGVAAEVGDVVVYPAECLDLVTDAVVV